jgi:hypothetical protein
MRQSLEETIIIAVVEGRRDEVAGHLREQFLDGELIEFYEQVSSLLDQVGDEVTRRGGHNRRAAEWQSTPVADTGEINVVRGRE